MLPSRPDRRAFLGRSAAWLALAALPAACRAPARRPRPRSFPSAPPAVPASGFFPAPGLDAPRILRSRVGLRPHRSGTFRVEADPGGLKPLVHNYGHGGAGWTLAWGSAVEAADLLGPPRNVAVLGAGVIGLTTASVLAERGFAVTVVAANHSSEEITSAAAGAQFAPAGVAWERTAAGRARMERMLLEGHRRFTTTLPALRPAVHRRTNYATRGPGKIALGRLPASIANPRRLTPLPIARRGGPLDGWAYDTLCIQPPAYLRGLRAHLHAAGVRFDARQLAGRLDLSSVPGEAAVNCLGVGAAEAVGDSAVTAVRGQVECLAPPADGGDGGGGLPYMLSDRGYVFGRSDCTVLGGTYSRDDFDLAPRAADRAAILAKVRRFFG